VKKEGIRVLGLVFVEKKGDWLAQRWREVLFGSSVEGC